MKIRDLTTTRLTHSVAEAGSGEPLLLLHGFTGAKEDFCDFLDGFGDRGWHAVAPDHRGHGASEQPDDEEAYSLEAMAEDVLALADALGWERFHLLGHSMGGMVAQLLALRAADRLSSLILMDTGHGAIEGLEPEVVDLVVALLRTEGLEHLLELAAAIDTRPKAPAEEKVKAERPGYVEFGERKVRASSPAMYAAMVAEMAVTPDRLERLAGLDLPTLVLVGDQDDGFLGPSERLAEAIPGAVLEVVPDAAHAPQFENPDRWWKVVTRFLDGQVG